ncbi:MAG TPA: sel1 repeat family protein [Ectothiorhodospiraceae bacterium]|nr:sel1 repeat family protein [Ectothiorhodospiraceae bacterium]
MFSTAEKLQQFLTQFKKAQTEEIQQQAKDGDAEAQFHLGALYANGRGVEFDLDEASQWLLKAAAQNEFSAMTLLGWINLQQEDGESGIKAMEWYQKAAEAGDVDAQCSIGDLHINGTAGIEPNAKAMLYWYEQAANHNHPKAQFQLGTILSEGKFVTQNSEAAFRWLTLAIMNGSEQAQKALQLLTAELGESQTEEFRNRMMNDFQQSH